MRLLLVKNVENFLAGSKNEATELYYRVKNKSLATLVGFGE